MSLKIYPYNMGSETARALSRALGVSLIKRQGSRFRGGPGHTVINWGCTEIPEWGGGTRVINGPAFVHDCSNKIRFFQFQTGARDPARLPPWTTMPLEASRMTAEGHTVLARRVVAGHSGEGISVVNPGQQMPNVPLYTQYIKKKSEYRVHFINGDVVDIQQKVLPRGFQGEPNWYVRSHRNGFIYVREGVRPPEDVITQATKAFNNSSLNFGAVDVIWNSHDRLAYVLEINTAPGLEASTLETYANTFRRLYQ